MRMLNTSHFFFFCSVWRARPFISTHNEINNLRTEPAVNHRMMLNSQEAVEEPGNMNDHCRTQPPLTSRPRSLGCNLLVDAPVASTLNTWAKSIHRLVQVVPLDAQQSPHPIKKLITSSTHRLKEILVQAEQRLVQCQCGPVWWGH